MQKLTKEQYVWVGIRLVVGWTLLWAFFDKLFGLGYATSSKNAWIHGGSPTAGYLKYASSGALSSFWSHLSGNTAIDALFMLALLAIGLATILGVGVKISGMTGALLMLMLWSTNLPPANNPITDEHILYLLVFVVMIFVKPGKWWGLGNWWSNTKLVKRFPILE